MRGVRTTLFKNETIETHHNSDIKAALNTIRENLLIGYDINIFLTYCDNKKQEKVIFEIKINEILVGYLEILK